MTPYYDDGQAVIYHGDAESILGSLRFDAVVTDPPYPNNAGWFDGAVPAARRVLSATGAPSVLTFWTELEHPIVPLPLVAVHIWHRTNVNGRPYEPIYHYAADGEKRRSEVMDYSVPFEGATGSAYVGHPTQKPVVIMRRLIEKTSGIVCDPFMGVGATLVAAKQIARKSIGIEIEERYCEIAAKRLSQQTLGLSA